MSEHNETKSRFMTASQLSIELGISEATLFKWVNAGKLPAPLRLGIRQRVWLRVVYENHINSLAENAGNERNHEDFR